MRFLHTSDWHIGKYLNDFSLLEDQRDYLHKLMQLAVDEQTDALIVSGDIYDRSVPPAEAVELLNDFLNELTLKFHIPVLMISGNHDGYRRLAFGGNFFREQQLYINSNENGVTEKVTLTDEHGPVNFYLIPYTEPAGVRARLDDPDIKTYNDAFQAVLGQIRPELDMSQRNIAVAHGFFSAVSDEKAVEESIYAPSEIAVGGADLINAGGLAAFDYAALGHLHRPHAVGVEHVRYAGSMLKYSLAEANQKKAVYLVGLQEKGRLTVQEKIIAPLRDLKIIRGRFEELMDRQGDAAQNAAGYVFAEIVEDGDILDAANKLRSVYPFLLGLRFLSNAQLRKDIPGLPPISVHKSPEELFYEFYETVAGEPIPGERKSIINEVITEIKAQEKA